MEASKPDYMRGKYINPEFYGQPADKSIFPDLRVEAKKSPEDPFELPQLNEYEKSETEKK